MSDDDTRSTPLRWAYLRLSIIGALLASPPPRGQLRRSIAELSCRVWRHPVTGEWTTFGASTIERWYYLARDADDPVAVLSRKVRSDAGSERVMSRALLEALKHQHLAHRGWSRQLHADNLAALAAEDPDRYGKAPSYSTVRRRMEARGWYRRRLPKRPTPGQRQAAERLDQLEVRGFESSHVHALWHLDFHQARRRVVDAKGQWHTPVALCVLDDRSRLACHFQWYLAETAENLVHGLMQAFGKRGLPRELMHDNGSAMLAEETQGGLKRLDVTSKPTLPYSPHQNGKQESFWDTAEGRLMALLEGVDDLSLSFLNRASQAWVEREYNRSTHDELGTTPLDRLLQGPEVSRRCPDSDMLRRSFSCRAVRTQRRSDGTVSVEGVRFELPARLRTLRKPTVRFRRWDLSVAWVIDPRTDEAIATIRPQDKAQNADGRRRRLDPLDDIVVPDAPPSDPIPALLRKYLAEYAATGLPPAYLPKEEVDLDGDLEDHTQEDHDDV